MTITNTATFDRTQQLEALRLAISSATTHAQQSGVALADITLLLLQRADVLCEIAEDAGVDMTKLATAFGGSDADV
jgi:hypothetical protein